MTLEDSAREISLKISDILKQLATAEDRGKIDAAMALDRTAFNNLINKISMEAIQKIEEEWLQLQQVPRVLEITAEELGECDCEILTRWSLPCKHWLLKCLQQKFPIPISLCHPRWVLGGLPYRLPQWWPAYSDAPMPTLDPQRRDIHQAFLNNMALREQMPPERQARFDDQILRTQHQLDAIAQGHQQLALLPIGMADEIPKKVWKQKSSHGKANARALTGAELSEQAQKKHEKELAEARAGKVRAVENANSVPMSEQVPVPPRGSSNSPPPPPTESSNSTPPPPESSNLAPPPPSRSNSPPGSSNLLPPATPPPPGTPPPPALPHRQKRSYNLVDRTPGKPAYPTRAAPVPPTSPTPRAPPAPPALHAPASPTPPAPPTPPTPPERASPTAPPASTAPPRLGRAIKKSWKAAGLSQPRH